MAAPVYVYDRETRALAKRLANAQHHHHDLSVATLHVQSTMTPVWKSPCCAAWVRSAISPNM